MKTLIVISLFLLSPLAVSGKGNLESGFMAEAVRKDSVISDTTGTNSPDGRMQKMRKRMMDRFMDKDGDGINDCRQKGMRWSGKGQMGEGAGKGKHKGFGRHGK